MIVQGSPEWLALRVGKVTASRVADLMATTKAGWAASRANYMAELVVERLTGASTPSFTNDAMRWGTEQEPHARQAYAQRCGCDVFEVAFIDHPEIAMTGASPDGLVGDDGLVEIKCPNTATHLETLETGAIPGKYLTQMAWQMACTGSAWCDFVSYDPRLPRPMQLFVKRVDRDVSLVLELEAGVTEFIAELDAKIARLRERYEPERAAA